MTMIVSSLPEPNERVLLQELNHRLSNSLQLIWLTIEKCRRQPTLSEMRVKLEDLETRLSAHAALHHRISNLTTEDTLENQCRLLCRDLLRIFDREDVTLVVRFDEVKIGPARALCLALLIVELVTNSLKHGLAPGKPGSIWIALRRLTTKEMALTVRDSGKPTKMIRAKGHPRIVSALTQSLAGKLAITQSDSYATCVCFPIETGEEPEAHNAKCAGCN